MKKLCIEDMQALAAENGGRCLSTTYTNNTTKLLWRCSEGHEWWASPKDIRNGHWCPHCAGNIPLTLDDMHTLAAKRGGKCLSQNYVNNGTKLHWQCAEGHEWHAVPSSIQQGCWCPECSDTKLKTIEDMHKLAGERGGECLSDKYVNIKAPLKWRCAEGHEWEACGDSVQRRTWCPYCAGKAPKYIGDMHNLAAEHDGQFLSEEYVNTQTKHRWRCKHGHEWEATPNSILRGTWCPICAGKHRTIRDMQELAKKRGGECLSTEFISSKTNLLWRCTEGHEWLASWNKIQQGRWCPTCAGSLMESICRIVLESSFGVKFSKCRPEWLTNLLTGSRLELDGFNGKLRMAFEYQGEQHEEPIYGKEALKGVRMRDGFKRARCKLNSVRLIEIPAIKCKPNDKTAILAHVRKACKTAGIALPKVSIRKLSLNDAYSRGRLEQFRQIAQDRGGECLSEVYINSKTPLRFRCSEGHEWETSPDCIRSGSWCAHCAGTARKTIEGMHQMAAERGGKCLSKKYVNWNTKLQWQCSKGHTWWAVPNSIRQGCWCPHCAGKHKNILYMQEVAAEKGGKCLSSIYSNNQTKLNWQCEHGHVWKARPADIQRGTWCPVCAGKHKSIADLQALARKRGGFCLSTKYEGMFKKHLWRCSQGHEWEANPNDIQQGTWCPYCRGRRKTLQDLKDMAAERGGKCLSDSYEGMAKKYRWQCAKGHEWEAVANSVQQGHWCPVCGRRRKPY